MKNSLLILALVMCSFYGYSQDVKSGVRTGVNVSDLDFEDDFATRIDHTHRNGFNIGFFVEYGITDDLYFAPEIQFSAQGSKQESLRIDYLNVPLYLKYNVTDKIAIGAGPQGAIKIHEHEDGYQNLAFSVLGGLEYMITDEIFIDARYAYGLTNIFDKEVGIEAKNNSMQFGVGIKF